MDRGVGLEQGEEGLLDREVGRVARGEDAIASLHAP
jgi:hypothetical protein